MILCNKLTYGFALLVETLCQQPFTLPGDVSVTKESGDLYSQQDDIESRLRARSDAPPSLRHQHSCPQPIRRISPGNFPVKSSATVDVSNEQSLGVTSRDTSRLSKQESLHDKFSKTLESEKKPFVTSPSDFSFLDKAEFGEKRNISPDCVDHGSSSLPDCLNTAGLDGVTGVREEQGMAGVGSVTSGGFRPLLLFIPLRLGQETFNMEYAEPLKVTHVYTVIHVLYVYSTCKI